MSEEKKCLTVDYAGPVERKDGAQGFAIILKHDSKICAPQGDGKKVATEEYRSGWDRIFGAKQEPGKA